MPVSYTSNTYLAGKNIHATKFEYLLQCCGLWNDIPDIVQRVIRTNLIAVSRFGGGVYRRLPGKKAKYTERINQAAAELAQTMIDLRTRDANMTAHINWMCSDSAAMTYPLTA